MRTALLLLGFAALAAAQPASLHPKYPLLDAEGDPVAKSGRPVSAMATCGTCHDTDYIAAHAYHARALGGFTPYSYDAGYGLDEKVRRFGARHAGGGPAAALGVELNCFLCHLAQADNRARVSELEAGRFAWAVTATLARTGLVERRGDGWVYDVPEVVDLAPRDPPSENCGFCHGPVHTGDDPFVYPAAEPYALTRGRVFSPQRLADSGMNLEGKASRGRPFDVHAERLVRCANCHFSPNNPAYRLEPEATRPRHLTFDARRSSFEEYLKRPDHDFARGRDGSMRRCADCHDAEATHDWLPQLGTHLRRVSCEACHIPRVPAPAAKSIDWTVPDAPRIEYRGVRGPAGDPASLVTGWEPALLENEEGQLAPYNVVAVRYWEDGGQPLALDRIALSDTKRLVEREFRYALHHSVAPARDALRDCQACHARPSRIDGIEGFYVPGHHRVQAIDRLGLALAAAVALGALAHAALRILGRKPR